MKLKKFIKIFSIMAFLVLSCFFAHTAFAAETSQYTPFLYKGQQVLKYKLEVKELPEHLKGTEGKEQYGKLEVNYNHLNSSFNSEGTIAFAKYIKQVCKERNVLLGWLQTYEEKLEINGVSITIGGDKKGIFKKKLIYHLTVDKSGHFFKDKGLDLDFTDWHLMALNVDIDSTNDPEVKKYPKSYLQFKWSPGEIDALNPPLPITSFHHFETPQYFNQPEWEQRLALRRAETLRKMQEEKAAQEERERAEVEREQKATRERERIRKKREEERKKDPAGFAKRERIKDLEEQIRETKIQRNCYKRSPLELAVYDQKIQSLEAQITLLIQSL